MTMTLDSQHRHHIGGMGYDHMSYTSQPQFTNPWGGSSTSHTASQLYPSSMTASMPYEALMKTPSARSSTMSMSYNALSATAPISNHNSYGSNAYSHSDVLASTQELLNGTRSSYEQSYSSAPQQSSSYSTSTSAYAPIGSYSQPLQHHQTDRSLPHSSASLSQTHASAFATDALDGARHMLAMSQTDITPRNIYGLRNDRPTTEAYGFPNTSATPHSAHSSVSSSNGYPQYFAGSVDSSVSDYSSASESLDGMTSRHLPRPQALVGSMPTGPQSMMSSFNSKMAAGTQKKHKCKICDKRFTRPSSLQTHMYSHTGEKPFACEVDGCGRNFSVVSNLRRHRKVHKGEQVSDHDSLDGSWTSRE